MTDQTGNQRDEEKRRSKNDLLLWFALLPFVLGSLFCCGELATLALFQNPPANTKSLFAANYMPWAYDEILPAMDMQAVANDILKDMPPSAAQQAATVVETVFLNLPTASFGGTGTATLPPAVNTTPSPTSPIVFKTPVVQGPTASRTSEATTRTPSLTPRATMTATPSRTSTNPPPPPPPTVTEPSPPQDTDTPAPPTATVDIPSPTFTFTPSITWTVTPSVTPSATPTDTPTATETLARVPVISIAEGNGVSVYDAASGGCRAYFGYLNSNPQPVTISLGPTNTLTNAAVQGTPPTSFKISRVFAAFSVVWTGGGNMGWTLDNNTATAFWCNPPVVP